MSSGLGRVVGESAGERDEASPEEVCCCGGACPGTGEAAGAGTGAGTSLER